MTLTHPRQRESHPADLLDGPQRSSAESTRHVHLGLGWIGDKGGGLERYQDGICRQHALAGIDVTALVQSRREIDRDTVPYTVHRFASPEESRRIKLNKLRRAMTPLLDSSATLVSHHASVSHSVMPLARDLPHVLHFHGPWAQEAQIEGSPKWKTWLQHQQEAQVYRSADRVITLSEAFKRIVVDDYGVDEQRVRVIPGAIEADTWHPDCSRQVARMQLGWPTDRPILLTIRRLVRRVGVDVLLTAIADIVDRHPDLLLLIGGTGPMAPQLDEMINAHGLTENVKRLGFVPAPDLSLSYRAANWSIVPTQYLEGFGLVTLESMAAGTPAIVTPVGSLGEVVEDLCPSLVLPGRDRRSIAEGLDAIVSGRVRTPNQQECRDYVRARFDWSVIAPRVLNAYQEARVS